MIKNEKKRKETPAILSNFNILVQDRDESFVCALLVANDRWTALRSSSGRMDTILTRNINNTIHFIYLSIYISIYLFAYLSAPIDRQAYILYFEFTLHVGLLHACPSALLFAALPANFESDRVIY